VREGEIEPGALTSFMRERFAGELRKQLSLSASDARALASVTEVRVASASESSDYGPVNITYLYIESQDVIGVAALLDSLTESDAAMSAETFVERNIAVRKSGIKLRNAVAAIIAQELRLGLSPNAFKSAAAAATPGGSTAAAAAANDVRRPTERQSAWTKGATMPEVSTNMKNEWNIAMKQGSDVVWYDDCMPVIAALAHQIALPAPVTKGIVFIAPGGAQHISANADYLFAYPAGLPLKARDHTEHRAADVSDADSKRVDDGHVAWREPREFHVALRSEAYDTSAIGDASTPPFEVLLKPSRATRSANVVVRRAWLVVAWLAGGSTEGMSLKNRLENIAAFEPRTMTDEIDAQEFLTVLARNVNDLEDAPMYSIKEVVRGETVTPEGKKRYTVLIDVLRTLLEKEADKSSAARNEVSALAK
jgi:hypothetical protein